MFKSKFASAIIACTTLAVVTPAFSDDFPRRPLRVVVPFSPGGVSDSVARAVVDAMAAESGKTVVVDYRPGADGIVGTEHVVSSPADGYTLLLASLAFVTTPGSRSDIKWSPTRDFSAVAPLVTIPSVLVTHPSLPAKTLKEFVSYAKTKDAKLTYVNAGSGSSSTLNAELLNEVAGIDVEAIPYNKGINAALPDLLTNRVNAMFLPLTFQEFLSTGKLRPLFVATPDRLSQLPDVPTAAEVGFPAVQLQSWFILVARKGTPREHIEYLNKLVGKALSRKEVAARMVAFGTVPMKSVSAADLDTFVADELRRVGPLVTKLASKQAAK